MSELDGLVFVVDDDASVRDAVRALLNAVGLRAEVFGSTEEFANFTRPEVPSCLVLEFQQVLAESGVRIPIIFVTAHGDVRMTSRAMKAGAVEFLQKPFQKDEFLS